MSVSRYDRFIDVSYSSFERKKSSSIIGFIRGVNFLNKAVSTDKIRPAMMFVNVEVDTENPSRVAMVSTDGRRMHVLYVNSDLARKVLFLEDGLWTIVSSTTTRAKLARIDKEHFENTYAHTKYPDWRKIVPKDSDMVGSIGFPGFKMYGYTLEGSKEIQDLMRSLPEKTYLNLKHIMDIGVDDWVVSHGKSSSDNIVRFANKAGDKFVLVARMAD